MAAEAMVSVASNNGLPCKSGGRRMEGVEESEGVM